MFVARYRNEIARRDPNDSRRGQPPRALCFLPKPRSTHATAGDLGRSLSGVAWQI